MFNMPEYINKILATLHTAGYEAFVVGGAVRDMVLGNIPTDFDITTSCPPENTVQLFKKTVATGIKHGTVTVFMDEKSAEVTTFRHEKGYTNRRSPDSVTFISALDEDLKRRDFTINAMCYCKEKGLIDNFGGRDDIKNRIIRAIGNPNERFCEDALRILRAFRFSAKLNFEIEKETFESAIKNANLLKEISRERIFAELRQILLSPYPKNIEPLINCGAFEFLGIKSAQNLEELDILPKEFNIRFYHLP